MPAGPHFVYATNTISENIPNIWHKSSTKHKEVRPIEETIKTIMQTTRHSYHMEGFTNGSGAILKIFDQVRKDLELWIVYSELKRPQQSHIIFTI